MIMAWGLVLVLYLLRDTAIGFLWDWMKMLLAIFVATLGINYFKKGIKAWWGKD
jgi:hypothetical protein